MSLTSSLSIAISSLLANQGAMAVVSNNIADANTPGYTREVPNVVEAPAQTFGDLQYGTGVNLQGIQSIRDNILQLRLNQETPAQSKLTTLSQGLSQIQTLFNESAGTGLQSLISNFFASFQQLSACVGWVTDTMKCPRWIFTKRPPGTFLRNRFRKLMNSISPVSRSS